MKHKAPVKLTRRGHVTLWVTVFVLMILVSGVDALWWSENPIPIR
jgi:hypothetical protein